MYQNQNTSNQLVDFDFFKWMKFKRCHSFNNNIFKIKQLNVEFFFIVYGLKTLLMDDGETYV